MNTSSPHQTASLRWRFVRIAYISLSLLAATAAADEPDKALLVAGFKRLKELKHDPIGICSENDKPGTVEIADGKKYKIATVIQAIAHMEGMQLSNNPKFEINDNTAFFNVGQKISVMAGGVELKKGECAVLKEGKLKKLDVKIEP